MKKILLTGVFILQMFMFAQEDAVNCIYFDGANDFIQTNLNAQPTAMPETTWEAWVKPTRLNYATEFQGILSTDDGGWDRGFWIKQNTNQLVIGYGGGGWIPAGITFTADVWYHIVVVYKTDNVLLYFNGTEYSLGIAPSGQATANTLTIGASGNGSGQWFQGEVDEVRIWNTARTQAEIQASYAPLAGNESGLAAYWRMDEGSGLTTGDASGHGFTSTLTNGPVWVVPSTAPVYAPAYQTSAESIDFGKVAINTTSDEYFTITNAGGGFLNIASVISDNPMFTVLPVSANIASGADQQFTVTFAPTTLPIHTGSLNITHNPNDFTHQITVSDSFFDGLGTETDPYLIETLTDLRTLSENNSVWDKYFIQTVDINASSTSGWNSGAGFSPIGNQSIAFSGNYNAQGFTIDSLYINRPGIDFQGLFGYTFESTIKNLGVTNVNITTLEDENIGGLAGWIDYTTIDNCYSTGSINGIFNAGGLIGFVNYSTINNCYSTAVVNCEGSAGGLAGCITESAVNNCYSTGSVTGIEYIGGLVGVRWSVSAMENCYSTGSVIGLVNVGGLVGWNHGPFINCYSTGMVIGNQFVGGFVGYDEGGSEAFNCFWDIMSSGQPASALGTGKITPEMKALFTFVGAGWDFTNVWNMDGFNNSGYPFLRWQIFALDAPQNLTIAYSSSNPELSWNAVTGAASYSFYSSADPYAVFSTWTLETSGETATSWTDLNATGTKKFYVVVAAN